MRFFLKTVPVILVCVLFLVSVTQAFKKNALVIGNSSYRHSTLVNPTNDSRDVAKILKELGFTVIHLENVTQQEMEQAIDEFGNRLALGGMGLFYYAGHGLQLKGWNYLVPIEADIREDTDVIYEAVDMGRILAAIARAKGGINIVILDACRNNPYTGFKSSNAGLARMDAPKGTLIAYATSPGAVAFDGSKRNSPFTESFLKHIGTPGLPIEQVFKRTRIDVDKLTDGKQIPWESTSLTADFSFNPSGVKVSSVVDEVVYSDIRLRRNLTMGRFVTFGTGGILGVYYPVGGAIARIVNRKKKKNGFQCAVESTGGSVENINAIIAGDREFVIAQSDRQYQAYHGLGAWKYSGAQKILRSVFSIHSESVTLIVAEDENIRSVQDLKGKRVNIGPRGSGQRAMAKTILSESGLNHRWALRTVSAPPREAVNMLQTGKIDALFYVAGHPSGIVKTATSSKRKTRIIPITGMESLLKRSPFYSRSIIPIEFYPHVANSKDIASIGFKATFVTAATIPDEIVYTITKEIFDNHYQFKAMHPAFKHLTKQDMLQALSAPLHPGALKYYKEAGLK